MADSKIEWTDKVWNPVRGCSRVSEGCRHCYAEKQAARFSGPGQPWDGFVRDGKWTGRVELVPDALDKPLRWRNPRRAFVNSMSDLFHEALPDDAIDRVFAVMALAPQHTFHVLTKRPDRMREYMRRGPWDLADGQRGYIDSINRASVELRGAPVFPTQALGMVPGVAWPLPNVWLGVSVEDQASADARIPTLLETPAAVRWVSYEPALGPVDLGLSSATCDCCARWSSRWVRLHRTVFPDMSALAAGEVHAASGPGVYRAYSNRHGALSVQTPGGLLGIRPNEFEALPRLDWIVVGGESGPGARPCNVAWIRSALEQCKAAGVACFVKQDSGRRSGMQGRLEDAVWQVKEYPRGA